MAQDDLAEISFWESVRDSNDPAELEAYLLTYPDGQFAPLARLRLNRLQGSPAEQIQHPAATQAGPSDGPVGGEEEAVSQKPFIHECDRLAAHALDPDRVTEGTAFEWIDPDAAVPACNAAIAAYPDLPRFRYQLSRALNKAGLKSAAVEQLRHAATSGHAMAMFRLGMTHLTGDGTPQDEAEALKWFRAAADEDFRDAMTFLGAMYQNGQGVAKNLAQAVDWYRKAAAMGEPQATYNLGIAYLNGQGVAQDDAQAIEWLRKAADRQYAPAMLKLGSLYEQGRGVREDLREALNWFYKAAENGNPIAYFLLARAHHNGSGTERDYRAAAEYMFRSLQTGYDFAVNQMTTSANSWSAAFRRELQRIMQEEGFYAGAIDGAFGSGTKRAIEALSTSLAIHESDYPTRNTDGERMLVNIPELNVFPRPSVRTDRLAALFMGDIVTLHQRQNDSKGEQWAKICTQRYCGWVAAEFLQVAPAQTSVELPSDIPEIVEPDISPAEQLPETVEPTVPPTEQLPESEGLGTLD